MSEFAPRLTLTTDVSQASWLAHTALETGVAGSFVPTGLEAYVQVLHPAETSEGDPVRWRVVADWLQAPLLAGVWFHDFEELAAGRPERVGRRLVSGLSLEKSMVNRPSNVLPD